MFIGVSESNHRAPNLPLLGCVLTPRFYLSLRLRSLCRQHIGAFKMFILSHLSKTGITTKYSKASLLSRKGGGGSQPEYPSDTEVYQGPDYAGNAPNKSIRTFIHSGKPHDLENDGIHLTFEMQNHTAQAGRPEHETLSSLEPVGTRN
ncbi:MAG: hypothetical protein Q9195_005642 [Heterodermia aff. obscurata]